MEERNGSKTPHKMDTIRRRGSQEWTQEEEKYILWNENDKKKESSRMDTRRGKIYPLEWK